MASNHIVLSFVEVSKTQRIPVT